ncbi:MAG: acetylornithine transaminase [Actinobacteria bacterium]|nr:acetylornithine transaminase [Actinomycetota bacterium]
MDFDQIKNLDNKYVMRTYNRLPVAFSEGKGARIWDTAGKEYIDLVSGIGVNILGHCHPVVVEAICNQAGRMVHTSNLYYIEPQAELAELICQHTFPGRCFFTNSGAEANEGALKLARKHHYDMGKPRKEFVCLKGSFHGRTFITLTATGQPGKWEPFMPLVPGFSHVTLDDIEELESAVSEETAAVMLEVIQGESGVNAASHEFIQAAREICDRTGALLILDEVQTGLGRTGTLFAYERTGVRPDILTIAKGLANGVPIGAFLAVPDIARAFNHGDHASTFGGNYLACAAAIATLKTLIEEDLPGRAETVGSRLMAGLRSMTADMSVVKEVRGVGLMIGIELKKNISREVVVACLDKGVIVNAVTPNTVRLLPPLIVEEEDAMEGIETLVNVLRQWS